MVEEWGKTAAASHQEKGDLQGKYQQETAAGSTQTDKAECGLSSGPRGGGEPAEMGHAN